MKIVIAPDSFKGSLSALEAALAIERGVCKAVPQAKTAVVPVADGGEGTTDSLVAATNGRTVEATVTGPLREPVRASFGLLGDGETCVVEMASASGLTLIEPARRNPMLTTTYGTGELIKRALDLGCRRFILAIGGSATNDGGIGMLQALGMRLLDAEGKDVGFGGAELGRVVDIDDAGFDPRIAASEFLIASDVQNPLIGPHGAAHVFGPQKGATEEMVLLLDDYLRTFADAVERKTGVRLHDKPGAGAAGGIGGAFQAFFPSRTERGIDIVIEYTGLKEKLRGADLVLTGEGQVDFQTASGKTPMGVAQEARKLGIPAIVLAGSVGKGIDALYPVGIASVHSIVNAPMTLEEAMARGAELLELAAEQVVRAFVASRA